MNYFRNLTTTINLNMKYTIQVKPERFLDTKVYNNSVITTKIKCSERKLLVHWSSKAPERYKKNSIVSEFQQRNT